MIRELKKISRTLMIEVLKRHIEQETDAHQTTYYKGVIMLLEEQTIPTTVEMVTIIDESKFKLKEAKHSLLEAVGRLADRTHHDESLLDLNPTDCTKFTVSLEALHAKWALTSFFDRLGRIIQTLAKLDPGAEVGFYLQLVELVAKFDILHSKLCHLGLEAGDLAHEVSEDKLSLCITNFLRDFVNTFNASNSVVNNTHNNSLGSRQHVVDTIIRDIENHGPLRQSIEGIQQEKCSIAPS